MNIPVKNPDVRWCAMRDMRAAGPPAGPPRKAEAARPALDLPAARSSDSKLQAGSATARVTAGRVLRPQLRLHKVAGRTLAGCRLADPDLRAVLSGNRARPLGRMRPHRGVQRTLRNQSSSWKPGISAPEALHPESRPDRQGAVATAPANLAPVCVMPRHCKSSRHPRRSSTEIGA